MSSIIPPLLLILILATVGFVVVGLFLPLVSLIEALS